MAGNRSAIIEIAANLGLDVGLALSSVTDQNKVAYYLGMILERDFRLKLPCFWAAGERMSEERTSRIIYSMRN